MPNDVIQQIDKVIDQQIGKGSPVTLFHLTEYDWLAVQAHKNRFPDVAAASGEPTADDERPRYLQVPVTRSFRDFSFAEFMETKDDRATPAWVRLDRPDLAVHQSSSLLGGEVYVDEEKLVQNNLFRAGMMARAGGGSAQPSLLGQPPQAGTAPQYSGFDLETEKRRDSVGNILADSDGEVITDSEGNPIEAPSEESAVMTDHVSATVVRRPPPATVVRPPPPEIPSIQPAALDFTLKDGRIAVVTNAALTDADTATVAAIFGMVCEAAAELARTLKTTNADGRLIDRVERVRNTADVLAPTLEAVFRLGHEADVLRIYLSRADPNELGPDSAAALEALVRRLDDCVSQYPAWRAFKRNARAADLTTEQIAAAPVIAQALVAEMEAPDGEEVVDPDVPQAFKDLVATFNFISTPDDPTGVIKAGCDLLAVDIVENLSNFIKVATSFAADVYGRRYFKGLKRKWGDLAEEDGERTAVWLHRALMVVLPLTVLGGPVGTTLWHVLLVTYPVVFPHLTSAWDFIQAWAPVVAQGAR